MSKCGSCGNYSFKVQQVEPQGSAFKLYFVECSSCGVPVGVTEYHNTGALITKLEEKIDGLSSEIEQINHNLSNLRNEIRK